MNYSLKQIRQMRPYQPQIEQRTKLTGLRLDFNERLSPLPNQVLNAIRNFDSQKLMAYPSYDDLVNKIACYAQVEEQSVMITNGSDQGIDLIFRTFVDKGDSVVIPAPSFAMFFRNAKLQCAKIIKPKYKSNGEFPYKEVLKLLRKKPKLLIICNPNNPTGTLLSLENIENIMRSSGETLVYVDEAYFEFSGITASGLIQKYPNLLITRTFSKAFGLASLRIGYVLSSKKNITELSKVRGPYDINKLAKVAAEASLNVDISDYCKEVMSNAKPLTENFFKENNIDFLPSGGNFIYFKIPSIGFCKKLEARGIFIKPQQNDFARVTVGTSGQMRNFIKIFKQLL